MKVVYYAPEYYADYGARTHATYFFGALSRDPRVSRAVLFPPPPMVGNSGQGSARRARLRAAVRHARQRVHEALPRAIREQVDLQWPSPPTYAALSALIVREDADAAILRLGRKFRYIERLKRDHPRVRLCIEYNSCPFDEGPALEWGERYWRGCEVDALSRADTVSVVTDWLRKYLVPLSPKLGESVFVNPNGVDPDVFRARDAAARRLARLRLGVPPSAFVLGYAGGMEEWRRMPDLVRYVGAARRAGLDDLYLVLLGTGRDLPRVNAAIASCGAELQGHVLCSGEWLPTQRVSELMSAFDVGIMSYQAAHTCAQKAFEYLSCALPVVGPRGSIPRQILGPDRGVYEFERGADGFVATVEYVYSNRAQARESAARGSLVVRNDFTWAANAARIIAAIQGTME